MVIKWTISAQFTVISPEIVFFRITVWLLWRYVFIILEQLRGNNVFYEFQRGRNRIFRLEIFSWACLRALQYETYRACNVFVMRMQKRSRQHVLPGFKILTMPQQGVSLCFIHFIQLLPCLVCVTGTKVFWWRRSSDTDVCGVPDWRAQLGHSVGLFKYECVCVVVFQSSIQCCITFVWSLNWTLIIHV